MARGSQFQLGWEELFDDPPPVPLIQQVVELFAQDQESQSYEFDPSVEAILADIEQDAVNLALPTCSSAPTTSSGAPTRTWSYGSSKSRGAVVRAMNSGIPPKTQVVRSCMEQLGGLSKPESATW